MAHQLVRQTPSGITIASGGTLTAALGSTVTISGTLTVPAGSIVATGAIASTTTLKAGSTLEVTTTSLLKGTVTIGNGYAGTGSTLTAAGAASFKGALIVDGISTLTGDVTIGAGAATLSCAGGTLTVTKAAINLVGATTVTGAIVGSTTLAIGTADHFSVSANGIITLDTAGSGGRVSIDGHGTTESLKLNATAGYIQLTGSGTNPDLYLAGAGSLATIEGRTAAGLHVADTATFAFIADQLSMRVKIGATIYQIPLWADA